MAHDIIANESIERFICERQFVTPIGFLKISPRSEAILGSQPPGISNTALVYVYSGKSAPGFPRQEQGGPS
jgi:hypothetical protein